MANVSLTPLKWLAVILGAVIVLLQYRLWLSDDGVRQLAHMRGAVAAQQQQNAVLTDRNRQLDAEVRDLKTGLVAIEERARSELGMIGTGETYYQVVPDPKGAGGQAVPGTGSGAAVPAATTAAARIPGPGAASGTAAALPSAVPQRTAR